MNKISQETKELQAEAAGPGRPRCQETRTAIMAAALELMEEGGVGAFSIDAVAKRSGAAKTTIYRWWPNKGALMVDVFLDVAEKRSPFPETGSAAEDFKTQMRSLARLMRGRLGRAFSAIIAEAQSDSETRKAFVEHYLRPRRAAGLKVMERGIANGEIRADLDPEIVADVLYAPFYLRMLFKHAPLDDEAIDRLADVVLEGLRPRAKSKA